MHNDRRFDVENSEHIDTDRVRRNVYWDYYQGFYHPKDQEHVGGTAGGEKEESKETIGFVAGDSKGGRRPLWHTTLQAKSSVLYLYEAAEYGNDECPVEARSISVFFLCERLLP